MSSLLQKVATLGVVLSELEKEIGIEDIGTIEKKVLYSNPVRKPTTDLVYNFTGTINRSQSVTHRMSEAMDRISLPDLSLQPFIQSSAG